MHPVGLFQRRNEGALQGQLLYNIVQAVELTTGVQEGITHTVDLPADDLETVERVLSFLYFNDYRERHHIKDLGRHLEALEDHPHPHWPTRKQRATSDDLGGYTHAEVYVAADKFGIPPLKKFAANRFQEWCAESWECQVFPITLEHALAIMPPHDTLFQETIVRAICTDAPRILEDDAMTRFLESHGKIASGVLSQLVQDDKIRGGTQVQYIATFINWALLKDKCSICHVKLQVKLRPGDFESRMFHCATCNTPYYL